jgi:hypothetical protein
MRSLRVLLLANVLLGVGASVACLVPDAALAQDKQAERLRLEEEMKKLAQRNAWTGVERNYEALLALGIDLPFDDHAVGAQAARSLGKTLEVYERLQRARKIKETPEIVQEMEAIDSSYGRVDLKGSERFLPQVTPAVMPFAPDQRKSIEWATQVMTNTGSFRGMLPLGDYKIVCQAFSVVSGPNFLTIPIEKPKAKEIAECMGDQAGSEDLTAGVIAYTGPVATLGFNFLATPDPTDPVMSGSDSNQHAAQAQAVTGSGISGQVGWEVGFNGANKTFGVAATVGYTGMFGGRTGDAKRPSTFHGGTGWLAATIRPGDLRIAVGPTWSMYYGSGTGVACWFELAPNDTWDPTSEGGDPYRCTRDESPDYEPNNIQWRGVSLAPGGALTVGYGFVEFGKLSGVVEVGGSFASDGTRNFINGGVRVGIVPAIDRFKK